MKIFYAMALLPMFAFAGTPPELPVFAPKDVDQTKDDLLKAAVRCTKQFLKNDGFAGQSSGGAFGFAGYGEKLETASPDPSVIINIDNDLGKIDARHIFRTTGLIAAGIVKTELTIDVKEKKYRMTWHDSQYAMDTPNWKNDFSLMIKEALPHKKAMAELAIVTQKISECIEKKQISENW